VIWRGIFFQKAATFRAFLGTHDVSDEGLREGTESVRSAGGIEVFSGDDLEAGSRDGWLVDEDDGARRATGVRDLGAGVRGDGVSGNGSCGQHDEAVGSGGNIEVAGIRAEGVACDERGDGTELLTGGDEIDIDGADSYGLIDEAESDLAGGCGLTLVRKRDLLWAADGVAEQDGVLGGSSEGRFSGEENLSGSSSVGVDGVDTWGERDVGGDGAEAKIEGERVGTLVDVEAGSFGCGVDDADLRLRRGADDGLAARKGDRRNDRERSG